MNTRLFLPQEKPQSSQIMSSSPSSSSCSHWWHAPIYFAATATLIFAAISSIPGDVTATGTPRGDPIPPDLILALHRSGFRLSAILLQISSIHVGVSSSPANLTLFALPDRHLSSFPSLPAALRLLRLHAVLRRLPFRFLSRLPRGTCMPTLLPDVTVHVTSPASLNGVAVTHPDLFLSGSHAVHGVGSRFDQQEHLPDSCHVSEIEWDRIIRVLRSSGYVSFSEALSTNLDALRGMLPQVTVFALRDCGIEGANRTGGPVVRRHVAVGRYSYAELAAMGIREVGTAEEGWRVRVTGGDGSVEVNGVEVVEPEVYVEETVVVHGIARDMLAEN